MRRRAKWTTLLTAVAGLVIGTASRADELYSVNLSPPAHVGEQYRYKASATEGSFTSTLNGGKSSPTNSASSLIEFNSIAEVQACDRRGLPSQVKFTVRNFSSSSPAPGGNIEPDLEVTARSARSQAEPPQHGDVFTLGSEPALPPQTAVLRKVITIGSETESTEQQAFGTDKLLPLGGTWPLDGEVGARVFAKMQIKANPRTVSGIARLTSVRTHANRACLEILMSVVGKDMPVSVPAGQVVNDANAVAYLTYYIDKETGRVVESKYRARIEVEVQKKDGDSLLTESQVKTISRDIEIADVPKPATLLR